MPWRERVKSFQTPAAAFIWSLLLGYFINDVSNKMQRFGYRIIAFIPYIGMFLLLFIVFMAQFIVEYFSDVSERTVARFIYWYHRLIDERAGVLPSHHNASNDLNVGSNGPLTSDPVLESSSPSRHQHTSTHQPSPFSTRHNSREHLSAGSSGSPTPDLGCGSSSPPRHQAIQGQVDGEICSAQSSRKSVPLDLETSGGRHANESAHSVEDNRGLSAKSINDKGKGKIVADSGTSRLSYKNHPPNGCINGYKAPKSAFLQSHHQNVPKTETVTVCAVVSLESIGDEGCSANSKCLSENNRANDKGVDPARAISHTPSQRCMMPAEVFKSTGPAVKRKKPVRWCQKKNARQGADTSAGSSGDGGPRGMTQVIRAMDLSGRDPSGKKAGGCSKVPNGGPSVSFKSAMETNSEARSESCDTMVVKLTIPDLELPDSQVPKVIFVFESGKEMKAELMQKLNCTQALPGSIILQKDPASISDLFRDINIAMQFQDNCTIQLGSVALFRKIDGVITYWRVQNHWTPTILSLSRHPRNLWSFLTGEAREWCVTGLNLQKTTLTAVTTERKEIVKAIQQYETHAGTTVIVFKEPLLYSMSGAEVYIYASNDVEVEGVTLKVYSEAKEIQQAYWISGASSVNFCNQKSFSHFYQYIIFPA